MIGLRGVTPWCKQRVTGEWVYSARGVGHVPDEMPPTLPSAPLGHTTSGTIGFRNPFDQPLTLDLALEQPSAQPGLDPPTSGL